MRGISAWAWIIIAISPRHPLLRRAGDAPFLGALLEKDKDYRPAQNLKETAAHLAATERTAMAAERDVMDGYKIAYLSRQAEKLLCGTIASINENGAALFFPPRNEAVKTRGNPHGPAGDRSPFCAEQIHSCRFGPY